MNESGNREAGTKGVVSDWRPGTIGVPAEDLSGEHGVGAGGQLHTPRRHLKDGRAAGCVEHVRPLEEARECLAVVAVANEAEANGRRNPTGDAAYVAAPAPKWKVQ